MRKLWWRKTLFANSLEDETFAFSEINMLVDLNVMMRNLETRDDFRGSKFYQ